MLHVLCDKKSRVAAKMLSSGAARVLTSSNIKIHSNEILNLFKVDRSLVSHAVNPLSSSLGSSFDLKDYFIRESSTSSVYTTFIDPYSLVLRNPDHILLMEDINIQSLPDMFWMEDRSFRLSSSDCAALLSGDELIRYGHRFISSSGIVSVKSHHVVRLLETWTVAAKMGENLDESIREKAVWNKTLVMLAGEMKQKPFERGEVIPVREGEIDWDEVRNACIVSVSDWKNEKAKEHFLRCLYFGHFFGDESGLMLNILDP